MDSWNLGCTNGCGVSFKASGLGPVMNARARGLWKVAHLLRTLESRRRLPSLPGTSPVATLFGSTLHLRPTLRPLVASSMKAFDIGVRDLRPRARPLRPKFCYLARIVNNKRPARSARSPIFLRVYLARSERFELPTLRFEVICYAVSQNCRGHQLDYRRNKQKKTMVPFSQLDTITN